MKRKVMNKRLVDETAKLAGTKFTNIHTHEAVKLFCKI